MNQSQACARLLPDIINSSNTKQSLVYTRKGDSGETSLYGSRRVRKDDPRVEAYGTIDELNSLLGIVVAGAKSKPIVFSLKRVQGMLFVAGGDAACEFEGSREVPRITAGDTAKLENMTDELLADLPSLSNFILPGGSPTGAMLHMARSVCRRAERRILTASRTERMNPELLPFFNRLSSYLFNLSRFVNKKKGKKEDIWKA
jgi:cob(I)alamin adenosyltransferase